MRRAIALLAVCSLLSVQLNAAHAQELSDPVVVESTISIDCSRFDEFTAEGQALANAQGLCLQGSSESPSDVVGPQGTVWGTCGSAQFQLADVVQPWRVYVYQQLNSGGTGSAMIEVLWYYELYYGDDGYTSYADEAYPWSTLWSRNGTNEVPPGYVFGFMGGSVLLANGWYCVIDYPYSETTIY
ncbi:MAG: hypothetical protein QM589_18570 [Thermomicrobiales bacterium]